MTRRIIKKKLLILAASPVGQNQGDLGREVREIKEGLRLARKRHLFDPTPEFALEIKDFRRALLNVRPHIVHFTGKGDPNKENQLMLKTSSGSRHLSAAELTEVFALCSNHVSCVVLNGCYSPSQAQTIAEHINHVIGIPRLIEEIGENAGIEFITAFYDGLGGGRSVEDAFQFGISALRTVNGGQQLPDLLKPILVTNDKSHYSRPDVDAERASFRVLGRMDPNELRRTMEDFSTLAEDNETDATAHFCLGHCYLQLKQYDLALACYQQAYKLEPQFAEAYYYHALAAIRGNPPMILKPSLVRESIEPNIQTAITLDPNQAIFYYLGLILEVEFFRRNALRRTNDFLERVLEKSSGWSHDPWEVERLLVSVPVSDESVISLIRGRC